MITIGKIQGILAHGPTTVSAPAVWTGPDALLRQHPAETQASPVSEAAVHPAAPEPTVGQQFADPRHMSDYRREVAAAIDEATVDPHLVGFSRDPDTNGTIIEIRTPDGTLITRFRPENVLNLERSMVDLSGMVVDQRT
jgi:hypothetical protein